MGSRAVRKLYGKYDLLGGSSLIGSESESEEEVVVKKVNPFAMLGGDDGDDDDDEDDEVEQEQVKEVEVEAEKPKEIKPKKKKKKSKKKKSSNNDDKKQTEDEDIDELIAQATKHDIKSVGPDYLHFFAVDSKHLDYEYELTKLFGKDIVNETIVDGGASFFPRATNRPKEWGGRDGRSVPGSSRRLVFSKARPHFIPTLKREIMMQEVAPEEEGTKAFKFVHSDSYASAQRLFQMLLPVADLQTIINQMLSKSLYHSSTLLMIAENMAQNGQHSEAADLVERALLVFDRGFKHTFTFDGSCRLPFKYFENRAFYLVLLRHIRALMRRGTWSTAFEFDKFLWSLSPIQDPFGAGAMIDFFALNAGQEKYLWQLTQNESIMEMTKNRPNLLYSRALTHQILHPTKTDKTIELLEQAVSKFPWVANQFLDNTFDHGIDVTEEQLILTGMYFLQIGPFWKKYEMNKLLKQALDVKLHPIKQNKKVSRDVVRYALLSEQKEVVQFIPKSVLEEPMWSDDLVPPLDDVNPYPPRRELREYMVGNQDAEFVADDLD